MITKCHNAHMHIIHQAGGTVTSLLKHNHCEGLTLVADELKRQWSCFVDLKAMLIV